MNRSPRHDATAGAMLSGSRSYFLQRTTMLDIREPSIIPENEAAVIVVEATMTKLLQMSTQNRLKGLITHVGSPDLRPSPAAIF